LLLDRRHRLLWFDSLLLPVKNTVTIRMQKGMDA